MDPSPTPRHGYRDGPEVPATPEPIVIGDSMGLVNFAGALFFAAMFSGLVAFLLAMPNSVWWIWLILSPLLLLFLWGTGMLLQWISVRVVPASGVLEVRRRAWFTLGRAVVQRTIALRDIESVKIEAKSYPRSVTITVVCCLASGERVPLWGSGQASDEPRHERARRKLEDALRAWKKLEAGLPQPR